MPSPFPGMDPYLEDPRRWPDVHHGLISELQATLNQLLRPKYYVRVEERVYISDEDDPGRSVLVPDLRVTRQAVREASEGTGRAPASLAIREPIVVTTLIEAEIRETRLEVIDAEGRQVVSIIEVVSPANKVAGARGRASYLSKRHEVMRSTSHWVEIDLLRSGESLVAAEVLPRGDYFVHISRVESRPKAFVWPIRLPERLPVIPIPLRPEDSDPALDLQPILDAVYERSAYDLDIDYGSAPVPDLPAEYAEWARRLLEENGRR